MTGTECQLYHSNFSTEKYFHNTVHVFLKEVYELMKNCYGPYGSHILINTGMRPEATKDGKTILSKLKTNNSISSAIHGSITSVADKQVSEVGDGSTTTMLLLCLLYDRFRSIINMHNLSPSVFNAAVKEITEKLIDLVKKNCTHQIVSEDGTIDFNMLENAIYTSVDGDKDLSDTIVSMFKELNCVDPLVLIEMSKTEGHSYELVKGVETDGSMIRPDVFFNGYSRKEYTNPNVIVVNGRLDLNLEYMNNIAEQALRNDTDYIFLCTGIDEGVLSQIVNIHNMQPALFSRVAIFQIRQTAQNDEFLDLCAAIGASPIDSESFKKAINFNVVMKQIETNAGTCAKALLTEFCARFNDPKSNDDAIKNRLDIIQEKIDDLEKDVSSHNDRLVDLEARKAFLSRNYAKFYVGGYSPQRKAINYELANDGIPQAISCMKHGYVYGCNSAIISAIRSSNILNEYGINKEYYKIDIIQAISDCYVEMFCQIVENKTNNYEEAEEIVHNAIYVSEDNYINLRDGDDTPVINSADTDRAILQNSVDMAALLATTKGFISQQTEFDVVSKGLAN